MADQVEEVKNKTDIVALISQYIELKKSGSNYKALCPFHSEKTPSFMVSPELQIFKCFGCDAKGDAISFLEQYEGMEFYEALKFLADKAGVKLQPLGRDEQGIKEKLYQINSYISYFYSWVLSKHSAGKSALAYLTDERGLTLETIKAFQLGFSPESAYALRKYLVDKKNFALKDIEKTGVFYTKNGQFLDRFRQRIIFPLHDHRGNIVGFAGRILPTERSKDLAKYINTPETEIYHKSSVLYALNLVKGAIKKQKEAVIMEGELDVISSWQAGIKNAVAIKGSALTSEQARLLSRYTKKIVLALDSDFAGDEAARRGIEIAEREGLIVSVARPSGFKDPDEAARSNPDILKESISESIGVWDFVTDSVFAHHKGGKGGDAIPKISKEIVPILSSISDSIVQASYIEKVARKLSIPVEAVSDELHKYKAKAGSGKAVVDAFTKTPTKGRRELLEEVMLAVLLRFDPDMILENEVRRLFTSTLSKRIIEEIENFRKKRKSFDHKLFASHLPKELEQGYQDLILMEIDGLNEDNYKDELAAVRRELEILSVKDKLEKISLAIRSQEKAGEKDKLENTQKEFTRLTKDLHDLQKTNFRGIIL